MITPSDFDHSPYFEIIKYPLLDLDDLAVYRKLPWDRTGVHCNVKGDAAIADKDNIELLATGHAEGLEEAIKAGKAIVEKPEGIPGNDTEPMGLEQNLKKQQNN